ncbi:hypothetical protein MK280_00905 [Myxococcota bacterium]|nr:hypothetical protein [Myxococcota bacterium]
MPAETCSVPVEHTAIAYEVSPIRGPQKRASQDRDPRDDLTFIDLIEAVGEVTQDEAEIVATVIHMLESGCVRLYGEWDNTEQEHRVSA